MNKNVFINAVWHLNYNSFDSKWVKLIKIWPVNLIFYNVCEVSNIYVSKFNKEIQYKSYVKKSFLNLINIYISIF